MSREMIFDVESIGLHGEGFAVAYVALLDGRRVTEGWAWCNPDAAIGTKEGRKWVAENVIGSGLDAPVQDSPPGIFLPTPAAVRAWFWQEWRREKALGSRLWAECPWPVEARFLAACVEDTRPAGRRLRLRRGGNKNTEPSVRERQGPYPLLDITTLLVAAGEDPLADVERLVDEKPVHYPLPDARHSGRKLAEVMVKLGRPL